MPMMPYALLSVSNKEGLWPLAQYLVQAGYRLLASGGTKASLEKGGFSVMAVEELTGFPECFDGRVKTLHPAIHARLLSRPGNKNDAAHLEGMGGAAIEVLVVNLYPFQEALSQGGPRALDEMIELIDIGGPAMLRAGAKNHAQVTVLSDPSQYEAFMKAHAAGTLDLPYRRRLALAVYQLTAAFDSAVSRYLEAELGMEAFPSQLLLRGEAGLPLRYGENPSQAAAFYAQTPLLQGSLAAAKQLQGKALSYNNYADSEAALALLAQFDAPTVVAVKHANPCGVASDQCIEAAYQKAYEADPVSIFGGIIAQNRPVTKAEALAMHDLFFEVLLAPDFSPEALLLLGKKKNLRLLQVEARPRGTRHWQHKSLYGGLLLQEADDVEMTSEAWKLATVCPFPHERLEDARFGMRVVRAVKSNAIVLVKDGQTVGIGPGQSNRIGALELALKMAGSKAEGAIVASDAFFPFADWVPLALEAKVAGVVQPGGSLRDAESVAACEAGGLPMLMTGQRHFQH